MRVRTGTRFGDIIGDITSLVDLNPTSVVLNGITKTKITASIKQAQANPDYFQPGNRILVDYDNGLPAWGGVLHPPYSWDISRGQVSVYCYTIEYLLKFRSAGPNEAYTERTVGDLFELAIRRANQKDPLGIEVGDVWQGGRHHSPRYHMDTTWDILTKSVRELEVCDFTFEPFVEDGKILFEASLHQVAGTDKSNSVTFVEGQNIQLTDPIEEQGPIANQHHAIASGADWGRDRTIVTGRNVDSVSKYGLLETSEVYNTSMYASLLMHVRNVLDTFSVPQRLFEVNALDISPAKFGTYGLGDEVGCVIPHYTFTGFRDTLRVVAIEYDKRQDSCTLVLESPREAEYWIQEEALNLGLKEEDEDVS